ncbi:MAG: methyl-accepting chemotaxis protein [Rhodospirillaceae bacterium]|nr:MAG: methyl-accepting chemotaxis protein [Rhodospirillaceae bacterium]
MSAAAVQDEYNLLGQIWIGILSFINNIKIKLVGTVIAGLILFMFAAGAVSVVVGLTHLYEVRSIWQTFDRTTANKMVLLVELRHGLGYGGLIHSFGDALAQRKPEALRNFQTSVQRIRAIVPAYRSAGVSDAESKALAVIVTLVGQYETALDRGRQAQDTGRIDDEAALAALAKLDEALVKARQNDSDGLNTAVGTMTASIVGVFLLNGFLLAVLAVFLVWFTRFRLVKPIYNLRNGMMDLSSGRRHIAIGYLEKRDEIGDLARSLQVFKENAERMEGMKREQEAEKHRAEQAKHTEMLRLADNLEGKVQSVIAAVMQGAAHIRQTVEVMGDRIGGGANRSLSAVQASQETTFKVTYMATAAEELAAVMNEVSRGMAESSEVAERAVTVVDKTQQQVRSLADAASKIGEVAELINDIADQTNLLALNATIEAARAGDAGKGFAIVAGEVKNLANQTAKATKDIAVQITAIQSATRETVAAIQDIGNATRATSESASRIANVTGQYTRQTEAIAGEARQVSTEAKTVSENVVSIAQSSASSCGSSIEVIWAAKDLHAPVKTLENEVNGFLVMIREG